MCTSTSTSRRLPRRSRHGRRWCSSTRPTILPGWSITQLQGVTIDMRQYARKRDLLCTNLAAIGYQFVKPQGGFYLFPRTPIPDDVSFVKALVQRRILTVPGSGFGTPGYFRIAYCVEDSTIEHAFDGFREVAREYGLS